MFNTALLFGFLFSAVILWACWKVFKFVKYIKAKKKALLERVFKDEAGE